nr:unnamed protein product [Callosobruchus analis]
MTYRNLLSLVRKKFICYEENQKLVENFNASREILHLMLIVHRKENSERTDSDSKHCCLKISTRQFELRNIRLIIMLLMEGDSYCWKVMKMKV